MFAHGEMCVRIKSSDRETTNEKIHRNKSSLLLYDQKKAVNRKENKQRTNKNKEAKLNKKFNSSGWAEAAPN